MISKEFPADNYLERRDIDQLTILQATELLADFCLRGQEHQSTSIATRMIVDGLYVAVGMTRDERSIDQDERWVHRMRLSTYNEPFRASSGLEVWLPYGSAMCRELPEVGEIKPADDKSSRSGVFVSYDEGQLFWNARELSPLHPKRPYNYWRDRIKQPFNILQNTVGQVDQCLTVDTIDNKKPGIGLALKGAVALADHGPTDLLMFEPENGIDLRTHRRSISEIFPGILFV